MNIENLPSHLDLLWAGLLNLLWRDGREIPKPNGVEEERWNLIIKEARINFENKKKNSEPWMQASLPDSVLDEYLLNLLRYEKEGLPFDMANKEAPCP